MIEYPAGAFDGAPYITMDTSLAGSIGDADPGNDVTYLRSIVFLDDGGVAGIQAGPHEPSLEVFDSLGTHTHTYGRAGEGPGEFRSIHWMYRGHGDTLAMVDDRLSRFSFFSAAHGHVADRAFHVYGRDGILTPVGQLADGSWLVSIPSPEGWMIVGRNAHKVDTPATPVSFGRIVLGDTAVVFDSVGTTGGIEIVHVGVGIALPRFFVSPIAVAWNDRIARMENPRQRIEVLDVRGKLVQVISFGGARRAVTLAMIDSAAVREAHRYADPNRMYPGELEDRKSRRSNPTVDSLSWYDRVRTSPDGMLWVSNFIVPGEPARQWIAIGPDGTVRGRFMVAAATVVEAFGAGRVLLRSENVDGIVRFEVHRLVMH